MCDLFLLYNNRQETTLKGRDRVMSIDRKVKGILLNVRR